MRPCIRAVRDIKHPILQLYRATSSQQEKETKEKTATVIEVDTDVSSVHFISFQLSQRCLDTAEAWLRLR